MRQPVVWISVILVIGLMVIITVLLVRMPPATSKIFIQRTGDPILLMCRLIRQRCRKTTSCLSKNVVAATRLPVQLTQNLPGRRGANMSTK